MTQARRPAPAARRPARKRPIDARTIVAPRRRLVAVGILVAMVMSLFAGRLLQLQGVEAAAYAATAEAERLRTVTIPATRGTITDANGIALATTVDAVNVTADQTQIADPVAVAAALAPVLGEPISTIHRRIDGDLRFAYVAKGITPKRWEAVAALRLPGIYNEPTAKRVYPQGSLGAALLGFVGSDGRGLEGLEYSWDTDLAGKDGEVTYELAAGGRRIPSADSEIAESVAGVDVQLTIDRDIQFIAEQAIRAKVRESSADSGTVVAMDPRTGEVLAMATYPSLDPSNPTAAADADRGNRAVTEIYEPGSTSKIMTMAAALDAGVVTPNTKIEVPPILYRGGDDFNDSSPHGTLHLTATGVLAQSSNIGMILIAERLGNQALYTYLRKFGMGSTSGVDVPGESAGLLPDV
ncbi:MAG: penicillin-binding protein 2, partial [Actinomycetia bacterium]|nr:penicillin-binding protein 2 [Actinomycetes bacterium]